MSKDETDAREDTDMLLNLLLVESRLTNPKILQSTAKKETAMHLKHVYFADEDTAFRSGDLYIVPAEKLPLSVPDLEMLSLITIGYPPAAYFESDRCELVCCSVNTNLDQLFLDVITIFNYFNDLENEIKDRIIAGAQISELGGLALKLFGTPVSIYGQFEKLLLVAYDPSRAENREYYQAAAAGEYLPEDERSILYKTPEFVDTFKERGVSFSNMNVYNTHILYKNIFNEDTFMGRVVLENTYRPFIDADYCLVDWFSYYISILMNRAKPFYFQTSREFECLIHDLVVSGAKFHKDEERVLMEIGWNVNDRYLAVQITMPTSQLGEQYLSNGAYYLMELFDSQYVLMQPTYLFQLINLTKSEYSYTEILRRLDLFLKNNAMVTSTSSLFSDFSEIDLYIRQVKLMSAYALADGTRKLYEYDHFVKEMLVYRMKGDNAPQTFFTKNLQELYNYDLKNNASLMQTLACYLKNNLNLSKTSKELYIARTTCLYRIKRIGEIGHLDLEDTETVQYLSLVMSLM